MKGHIVYAVRFLEGKGFLDVPGGNRSVPFKEAHLFMSAEEAQREVDVRVEWREVVAVRWEVDDRIVFDDGRVTNRPRFIRKMKVVRPKAKVLS